jgi:holo-[acyl-carrier protein] synthase|tara:strand:- start:50 stop:433 length:384 start_codon:yes stop_codon:yes gene_type:complete
MKIYGIGTDITNINRIKKLIKNKKFIYRIFHKSEINKCNKQKNISNCYAKRFAAKEAFSKALGTGISKGINFREIYVNNVSTGKPTIKLEGKTKMITEKKLKTKKFGMFLSLSDDKPFALATVVISL